MTPMTLGDLRCIARATEQAAYEDEACWGVPLAELSWKAFDHRFAKFSRLSSCHVEFFTRKRDDLDGGKSLL